ncbi:MAG: hypothetical protein KJZ64_11810 [Sphingomonadaceae bacterium]|nr:hypothetical protein [Sphingomonadaceae bacterium]
MEQSGAAQVVLKVDGLPGDALGAASAFHARHVAAVRDAAAKGAASIVLVLQPAPVDHTDWRRAAVRDLARALAPVRVNLVAGLAGARLEGTLAYLGNAPGVTGHYLPLHGD